MMKTAIGITAAMLMMSGAAMAQGTASATLPIIVTPTPPPPAQITISFAPPNPTVPCNATPGTFVSQVTAGVAAGTGDGNALALSASGDTTDFALAGTAPPTNVIVGPNGISA